MTASKGPRAGTGQRIRRSTRMRRKQKRRMRRRMIGGEKRTRQKSKTENGRGRIEDTKITSAHFCQICLLPVADGPEGMSKRLDLHRTSPPDAPGTVYSIKQQAPSRKQHKLISLISLVIGTAAKQTCAWYVTFTGLMSGTAYFALRAAVRYLYNWCSMTRIRCHLVYCC